MHDHKEIGRQIAETLAQNADCLVASFARANPDIPFDQIEIVTEGNRITVRQATMPTMANPTADEIMRLLGMVTELRHLDPRQRWCIEWTVKGVLNAVEQNRLLQAARAADKAPTYPLTEEEIMIALNSGNCPDLPKEITENWTKHANNGVEMPGEICAFHAGWGAAWRAAIHRLFGGTAF